MCVEHANRHAQLPLDAVTDGIDAVLRVRVLVHNEQLPTSDLEAMYEGIAGQVVVDQGGGRSDSPRAQGAEDEFGLVGQAECDERAGRDTIPEEVLAVATGIGIRLSPCVASDAGPDGLFVGRQPSRLGLEPIPEAAPVLRACPAEFSLRRLVIADTTNVAANVKFGVEIRGGRGCACNGTGNGDCYSQREVAER